VGNGLLVHSDKSNGPINKKRRKKRFEIRF